MKITYSLFLIAVVIVLILVFADGKNLGRSGRTCMQSGCVQSAGELDEYIDAGADPCEDFYEFTCGKFLDSLELENQPMKSSESIMIASFNNRIRGIIQDPHSDNDTRALSMAKILYSACMSPEATENGLQLFRNTIKQMGGWAILDGDNWIEDYFDWRSVTYRLRQLGYSFDFFIKISVVPDNIDPSKRILELSRPWSFVFDSTEDEELLLNYMVDIAVAFDADRSRAETEYRDVIEFLKSLEPVPEDYIDEQSQDQRYTITELQYKFRDIPWLEYTQQTLFPIPNIYYDQIIMVKDAPYIYKLQGALKNATKRVLSNYISVRTVMDQTSFLTPEFIELSRNFHKALNNQESLPPMPPRPQYCSFITHNIFKIAVRAAYVEKYISNDAKNDVEVMVRNIIDKFKDEILDAEWMDYETKNKAIARLSEVSSYVAFPDELLNTQTIEDIFNGYYMQEDNFLGSVLNAMYYKTNSEFQEIHLTIDEDEFPLRNYFIFDVEYSVHDNSIVVPDVVLDGVLYKEGRPEYLNYGSLGSFIGYQIFHAIFEGGFYSSDNSQYEDWLSPQTLSKYSTKLSCVEDHYDQYFIPELENYLNSSQTKYEDIADIAGIKLAYDAYKEWTNNNGSELKLPQLGYTPKQLFWISSAIRFCSKGTPETLNNDLSHSFLSPNRYRVLGTLRNLEEFSNDFNCQEDSYMNPGDKCNIF